MAQNDGLLKNIRRQTRLILDSNEIDNKGVDAYTLSIDLKQDRSNVSRTLNKMWREGL